MSRFARHYPDDYEDRWERMCDAADHARKAKREDAALASVAESDPTPSPPSEPVGPSAITESGGPASAEANNGS